MVHLIGVRIQDVPAGDNQHVTPVRLVSQRFCGAVRRGPRVQHAQRHVAVGRVTDVSAQRLRERAVRHDDVAVKGFHFDRPACADRTRTVRIHPVLVDGIVRIHPDTAARVHNRVQDDLRKVAVIIRIQQHVARGLHADAGHARPLSQRIPVIHGDRPVIGNQLDRAAHRFQVAQASRSDSSRRAGIQADPVHAGENDRVHGDVRTLIQIDAAGRLRGHRRGLKIQRVAGNQRRAAVHVEHAGFSDSAQRAQLQTPCEHVHHAGAEREDEAIRTMVHQIGVRIQDVPAGDNLHVTPVRLVSQRFRSAVRRGPCVERTQNNIAARGLIPDVCAIRLRNRAVRHDNGTIPIKRLHINCADRPDGTEQVLAGLPLEISVVQVQYAIRIPIHPILVNTVICKNRHVSVCDDCRVQNHVRRITIVPGIQKHVIYGLHADA